MSNEKELSRMKFKFGDMVRHKETGELLIVSDLEKDENNIVAMYQADAIVWSVDKDLLELVPHPDTVRLEYMGKLVAESMGMKYDAVEHRRQIDESIKSTSKPRFFWIGEETEIFVGKDIYVILDKFFKDDEGKEILENGLFGEIDPNGKMVRLDCPVQVADDFIPMLSLAGIDWQDNPRQVCTKY
ncbi:hypothetical protein [Neisseria wadsworthii]|uniref:Uncharacterized protein n=1 Tax=Neisseria wadsworthii 9715 TaxID=1030841 RepID=G4CPK9_9NEIS|nr:hypothetical protein [Neisseria wadsworthii]EGZ47772.1 hypothetical protein HMPREF9370_1019 [Neisseria wadsworthii 9715]